MKKLAVPAVLAVGCLAFALAQAPAPVRVLWTFAGPSNPGYEWVTLAAAENNLVYAVKPGPSWSFATENGQFKETGSTITALDLGTGSVTWAAESRWPILSPLLLTAGRLVAHNGYGEVLCFDARNGKPLWKVEPELHPGGWDERTMPLAQGESIFLREENEIVCRSIKDGKAVWRTAVEAVQNRRVFPALAGDRLIVANAMDAVLALDAKTGKILWRKKLDGIGETVLAGPSFALISNADRTFNLDPASGREIWNVGLPPMKFEFNTEKMKQQDPRQLHEPIWNLEGVKALAVQGERVFVFQKRVMYPQGSPFMPELACYDLATVGDMRWSQSLGSEFQGLSVAGPMVLTVEGRTIIARSAAEGRVAWEFEVPGEKLLQGQALAVGGKILVVGSTGLTCLETGDPLLTGWAQCGGGPSRSGAVR
jgi:outer membrane protein assembly factor BamB